MPAHQRRRLDDRHRLQDGRESAIKQNEEQPIAIREPDTTAHLALQDCQLPFERGILRRTLVFGLHGDIGSLPRKMSGPIIVASHYGFVAN